METAHTAPFRVIALALMLAGPRIEAEGPETRTAGQPERAYFVWGLESTTAAFFYEFPLCMPLVGVEGRLGSKINQRVGIFGTLGLSAGMSRWDFDTQLALSLRPGFLVELTFADRFFGAVGAALMVGWWSDLNSERYGRMFAGPLGGALDLRVGMGLGRRAALSGKGKFSIAIDVLVLFAPASFLGGRLEGGRLRIGYRSGLAVGFTPTLMLGYGVR